VCGIGACLSFTGENVTPKILKMLKNLEYRGYDSAGMAVMNHKGTIEIRKDVGKIDELVEKLNLKELYGYVGVGHTRWATHGPVTKWNAHPHIGCDEKKV